MILPGRPTGCYLKMLAPPGPTKQPDDDEGYAREDASPE